MKLTREQFKAMIQDVLEELLAEKMKQEQTTTGDVMGFNAPLKKDLNKRKTPYDDEDELTEANINIFMNGYFDQKPFVVDGNPAEIAKAIRKAGWDVEDVEDENVDVWADDKVQKSKILSFLKKSFPGGKR